VLGIDWDANEAMKRSRLLLAAGLEAYSAYLGGGAFPIRIVDERVIERQGLTLAESVSLVHPEAFAELLPAMLAELFSL
jgi:hypothetical protein